MIHYLVHYKHCQLEAQSSRRRLVLQEAQATLDDDVLKDRAGRNVDGAVLGSHDDDSTCSSLVNVERLS